MWLDGLDGDGSSAHQESNFRFDVMSAISPITSLVWDIISHLTGAQHSRGALRVFIYIAFCISKQSKVSVSGNTRSCMLEHNLLCAK
jgi:hypothetical protein